MSKICAYQPTSCELIDGNPTIRINYYSRDEDDQLVIEKVIIITAVMINCRTAYLKIVKEGCWDSTLGPIAGWDINKNTFEKLGKATSMQLLRGYLSFTVGKYNSDHLPTDGFTTINIYELMETKLAKDYESFCKMMYDAIMAQ
jgi:hypothetical protein